VGLEPGGGGFGLGHALRRQRAIGIGLAGNSRFGVGMTEQDKFAHAPIMRTKHPLSVNWAKKIADSCRTAAGSTPLPPGQGQGEVSAPCCPFHRTRIRLLAPPSPGEGFTPKPAEVGGVSGRFFQPAQQRRPIGLMREDLLGVVVEQAFAEADQQHIGLRIA